jgi:hypothetical protein
LCRAGQLKQESVYVFLIQKKFPKKSVYASTGARRRLEVELCERAWLLEASAPLLLCPMPFFYFLRPCLAEEIYSGLVGIILGGFGENTSIYY